MKKVFLISVFCSIILSLTACSDKIIDISIKNNTSTTVQEIQTDLSTEGITDFEKSDYKVTEPITENFATEKVTENFNIEKTTEFLIENTTENLFSASDYVSVGKEKNYKYSDNVGNDYDVTLKRPQINNINGVSFDDINNKIISDCQRDFEDAEEGLKNKTSLIVADMDYEYYLNFDILSIIITHNTSWGGFTTYNVYNINVNTGKILYNEDIANAIGISQGDLKSKLRNSLERDYKKKYINFDESYLDSTLSEENIEKSQIFIGDNGQLMALCTEYIETGAETYSHIINVE